MLTDYQIDVIVLWFKITDNGESRATPVLTRRFVHSYQSIDASSITPTPTPINEMNDRHQLHTNLTHILLFLCIPTFISLQYCIVAPFGRHSYTKCSTARSIKSKLINFFFHPLLSPRYAWMCFECPNLLWSFYYYYNKEKNTEFIFHDISYNEIVLALFIIHYVNRSIIYPMRIDNELSKRVPISIFLSAFSFCALNG